MVAPGLRPVPDTTLLCTAEASVQEMLSQSPLEELEQKERELSFSTGMCALTILRSALPGRITLRHFRLTH